MVVSFFRRKSQTLFSWSLYNEAQLKGNHRSNTAFSPHEVSLLVDIAVTLGLMSSMQGQEVRVIGAVRCRTSRASS